MTVILLTNAKPSVRGELTRWMLEPKAGVFVGQITPTVRQRLWARVQRSVGGDTMAILLYSADAEQGYQVEMLGHGSRVVRDFDGLSLIARTRDEHET